MGSRKNMKPKHKLAYMKCAEAFAECSNATRLKVGSVIVKDNRIISCGYNAHAEHISDPCELADGTTDPRVRHSEKNALMGLTKSNQSAVGAVLFCTHACCKFCAIDIVDAGIKKVYYRYAYRDESGVEYLHRNNVEVERI
jgi:dCMP deaminase